MHHWKQAMMMNMIMIFMTTITDMEMIKTMAIIICAPSIYPNPSPFIGSTNISSSAGKDWFNNPDPDPLLEEKLTSQKLRRYWKIHPLCPRDFPRPTRLPSGILPLLWCTDTILGFQGHCLFLTGPFKINIFFGENFNNIKMKQGIPP